MSNLRKYVLAQDWGIKAGVIVETASTVLITEERADQLKKAGIILGEPEGDTKEVYKRANRQNKDSK